MRLNPLWTCRRQRKLCHSSPSTGGKDGGWYLVLAGFTPLLRSLSCCWFCWFLQRGRTLRASAGWIQCTGATRARPSAVACPWPRRQGQPQGSIVVDGAAVVNTYFRMPGMGKAKSVLLARFTGATEETRSPFVVAALLGSGSFKTRRRTETSTSAPPWKDTRLS